MSTPTPVLPVLALGIPLHPVSMAQTLARIDDIVEDRRPRYFVTANVHFAAAARRDAELQRILCEADLVLCDGTPLLWAARALGAKMPERVAGSDLLPLLLAHAAERGYRLFFLGSTPDVLAEAAKRATAQHPTLRLAGTLAPPQADLRDLDLDAIRAAIRAAKPDVLLVALGCPKQEKLIARLHRELGVPCSIGVGASLDFLAGRFSRAPRWMKRAGLEWLYRLLHEPLRLYPRYAEDFRFFFPRLAAQLWHNARRRDLAPFAPPVDLGAASWTHWVGRADGRALSAGALPLPTPRGDGQLVALALEQVEVIDALALGALVHAWKTCRERRCPLLLYRPSPAVTQALCAARLERVLWIAHTAAEAHQLAARPSRTTRALELGASARAHRAR